MLGNPGDADRVLHAYAQYLDVDAVAAEKPKPSQERLASRRRPARSLLILLWIGVSAPLVVALAYVVGTTLRDSADGSSGDRQLTTVSRPATPATIPNPSTTPERKAGSKRRSASKSPAQPQVRLVLTAARGGSWVEARAGSPTGSVLFSGTLTVGRMLRLSGRRLWIRFGAASNLAFTLNGRQTGEDLYGTVETLVTPQGIRRT